MNFEIIDLHTHIRNLLDECQKNFDFRKHTNNTPCRKDTFFINYYGDVDDLDIISAKRTVDSDDFFFFVLNMARNGASYRETNNFMRRTGLTDVSVDAYKKARQRKSYMMFEHIYNSLVRYYRKLYAKYNTKKTAVENDEKYCNTNDIKINFAHVDGAHYSWLKALNKYGMKMYNTQKCTSGTISVILSAENLMPINIKLDTNNSELAAFLDQLNEIDDKYVFIFDRNYYSKDALNAILKKGCGAVFRMKSDHVLFVREFNNQSSVNDKIIYIKDGIRVNYDTTDAIKIRLLKYEIKDETYVLCTTLIDKKNMIMNS